MFCLMFDILTLKIIANASLIHSQMCEFSNFTMPAYSGAGVGVVTFTASAGGVVILVSTGGDVVEFAPAAVVGGGVVVAPGAVVSVTEVTFGPEVIGVGFSVVPNAGACVTGEPETLGGMVGDVILGAVVGGIVVEAMVVGGKVVGGIVVALTAAVMFTAST